VVWVEGSVSVLRRIALTAVLSGTAAACAAQSPATDATQAGGHAAIPQASAVESSPQTASLSAPAAPASTYEVPAGTKVLLQLKSGVNSKSAKPGDGVYLTSAFPVVVGNHVLIPAGVYVQGVVDRVVRAGRIKGKAQLDMHFTSMIFPNGTVVEIPGGVNGLPGAKHQTVKNDGEGTIVQDSGKGRNAAETAKIALPTGATAGTIGGAVAGHPISGGLIGLAAGAATVGVVSLFTRGADVEIPSGSQVEMIFQRPLLLQAENLSATSGTPSTATALVPSPNQPKPLAKPILDKTPLLCPPGSLGCE
jgi:type IV secretion system protein VirB10